MRRSHFRLEVRFIGEQLDQASAAEEWPLVKALEQFGSLTGLQALVSVCNTPTAPRGVATPAQVCSNPTFDLTRTRYSSRYVDLVYRDLVNRNRDCAVGKLKGFDLSLFLRFGRPVYRQASRLCSYAKLHGGLPAYLPLLLVAGYLQVGNFITVPGDFETPTGEGTATFLTALPFDTVHAALQSGRDPSGTQLNYHVNAEANLIAALICHGDGRRPAKVCGRPVIKQYLRHVK